VPRSTKSTSSAQSKSTPPAVQPSSSHQRASKHDADAGMEDIQISFRKPTEDISKQNEPLCSQRASFKFGDYHNNDFELVVKISKHLEFVLEQEYGAEGHGLGKISTTNTNTNCILSAESGINQFEFMKKLKQQENNKIFFCLYFNFSTYLLSFKQSKKWFPIR